MDITASQATLITVAITGAVTLVAALITALVTLNTNALARKNEHRLSILQVLPEAAYKEYEFRTTEDFAAAKSSGRTPKIKSFTEYIIFYREMSEIFSKETVTEADIITSLEKIKT